jgi:hypothetical protein
MCERHPPRLATAQAIDAWSRGPVAAPGTERPATTGPLAAAAPVMAAAPGGGSRRARLWDLPAAAHCPVVGICVPLPVLRQLVDKVIGPSRGASDHALHGGAVQACARRGPLAEALQRDLDRRHAGALRACSVLRDEAQLEAWWRARSQGPDVASAFWAVLTHPRCSGGLLDRVLQEMHMLQHELAALGRADRRRQAELLDENAVLTRALAEAQRRHQALAQEQAARTGTLQAQLMRARADLLGRDTLLARLQEQLEEAADAGRLAALHERCERQAARITALEATVRRLQSVRSAGHAPVDTGLPPPALHRTAPSPARPAFPADAPEPGPAPTLPTPLGDRAVLCVGGRPASVPVYRELVEGHGARFLHHDGGLEQPVPQLDATLAAADLVICQTGCISHDAYWRVKAHCKRTGTPCVFVEQPSRSALDRALRELRPQVAREALGAGGTRPQEAG